MATELPIDADGILLLKVTEAYPSVDTTYDPTSANPQSGIAVAQALKTNVTVEGTALKIGG